MDRGDGLFHHSLPEKSCSLVHVSGTFPLMPGPTPSPKTVNSKISNISATLTYSSNPPYSSGFIFLTKQSGPNWSDISKIPSLPPNLSFSFFLCYSHLSIPANGTPIIPHQSRLLSFGKVPWSYWHRWAFTATTQLFNCDYFPTSSFILPVSQSPQNWVLYII